MRIKFLKEFRLVGNDRSDGDDRTAPVGHTVDLDDEESARWLIDNGFAEKVKANEWWKPKKGEAYYYLDDSGTVTYRIWMDDNSDENRFRIGNCFKTREATKKWRDYLKATVVVRQDEGVLTPVAAFNNLQRAGHEPWTVETLYTSVQRVTCLNSHWPIIGAIYFDTRKNTQASLDMHRKEWNIMADYDWSRG